jgi:hypothetical protein
MPVPQLPTSNSTRSQEQKCSSLTNNSSLFCTELHCTYSLTNCPAYNILARTPQRNLCSVAVQLLLSGPHRKHRSSVVVVVVVVVVVLVHVRNLLPSSECCLKSHYLATSLHATMFCFILLVSIMSIEYYTSPHGCSYMCVCVCK